MLVCRPELTRPPSCFTRYERSVNKTNGVQNKAEPRVYVFTNNVNVNKTGPRPRTRSITTSPAMHTRGGFGQTTSLERENVLLSEK